MHIDLAALFGLSLPAAEIVIRGTATYWFLFLMFRFIVRRDIGAVGLADILVLVIVADASQNAMAGDYKSVGDGMVLVATLIFWNMACDWLAFHFPVFRRFAEPSSLVLVRNGRLLKRNMRREFISEDELWSKLREEGVEALDEVRIVVLEPDGQFSVIRKKRG